ncbi:MAG: hypothetical protein AB7S74_17545 [Hyphomicrobium sp.]
MNYAIRMCWALSDWAYESAGQEETSPLAQVFFDACGKLGFWAAMALKGEALDCWRELQAEACCAY